MDNTDKQLVISQIQAILIHLKGVWYRLESDKQDSLIKNAMASLRQLVEELRNSKTQIQ